MEPLLFIPIMLSFFVTLLALPSWIKKAKKIGLVWEDMNKYTHPKNVAGSGGIIVVMGFVLGVLCYIAIKTFVLQTNVTTVEIFALLTTILIVSFVGIVDDIFGWQRGGLSARLRIALIFLAAVPLMVINAGYTRVGIPFITEINLGLLYPLIIIPLGVIGASTTFNFLAGYNGLEAGQGVLIIGALSAVAFLTGNSWLALVGLCMIASLLAFLFFNRFPAKIFPGDALTYSVGALVAIIAILGNFERVAVFFFIPYIIEMILKVRGKLKKESFGIPQKDGSLELPYKKIYGLEHFVIWFLKKIKKNKKVYEKEVIYFIYALQIVIIILGFIIFKKHIF
jgi:UDP-N-acetylglucosamine--dolichyl-phosphate N-acetylglucosaminephosphotransferase